MRVENGGSRSDGNWLGLECILEIKLSGLDDGLDVGMTKKHLLTDTSQVFFASTAG